MPVYSFESRQLLELSLEKAWAFFSDPRNLQRITPAFMDFRIRSSFHKNEMYPGQIIEYTVRPIAGIPVYWMTEITHVVDKVIFVDEQRVGPYSLWHHQHHFMVTEKGVEMTDIVHYRPPLGLLGALANRLFIKKKLKEIFSYRARVIKELLSSGEL
jgi:ligand-binding SRPBCC domain-containing protein